MARWFGFLLLLASLGIYVANGTSDPPPDPGDPPPVPGDGLPFPTPDPSGSPPVAALPPQ